MVAVVWSNGQRDEARTWDELLDVVRASQPSRYAPAAFRKELARRAQLWSGFRIDHRLPARKLFRELEWAKVIMIVDAREESP